jgi:hypothetical protein
MKMRCSIDIFEQKHENIQQPKWKVLKFVHFSFCLLYILVFCSNKLKEQRIFLTSK